MSYYKFISDDGSGEYGSFETFCVGVSEGENTDCSPGWYWWPCFPGCLPDGEPIGPFDSEDLAIQDARYG